MAEKEQITWLLLIHQIPPEPGYLRVKIGRRLQRIGAVSIKNSVYVLPHNDQFHEDFEWMLREIDAGGGEAMVCEAAFIEGLSDAQVKDLFQAARDEDYRKIAEDLQGLSGRVPALPSHENGEWSQLRRDTSRLKRRLADVAAIDYFGALGRSEAEAALLGLEGRLRASQAEVADDDDAGAAAKNTAETYRGRTWVTRAGVNIDRIASAWLIRGFIDEAARFKFVAERSYGPAKDELRFDMFEAEFTHEGEDCTFEVLLKRIGLTDPALAAIAEIVHDLDLKDGKFGRPETPGVGAFVNSLALRHAEDGKRLEHGAALFEDLYLWFRHPSQEPS